MTPASLWVALLSAAAVAAEFVGGKATRDALFLTSMHVGALPGVLIVTGLFSMALVFGHSRLSRRVSPATLVPAMFVVSGALFFLEWICRDVMPAATAVAVYLHVSGLGPLLGSGFWLLASDHFDPRTAKSRFGQIAGAGTMGGLLGALLAERVAAHLGAPSMLPVLGVLQFATVWPVTVLARSTRLTARATSTPPADRRDHSARSGARTIAETPHLRYVTALVLLGTTGAALLEYLFKTRAVFVFGPGDGLLRFFAAYYALTSLASFAMQMAGSLVIGRFGLGMATAAPSIALVAGALTNLVVPGFGSLVVARAGESVLRNSWFRAGYELFFTPMPSRQKRAAKPIIDVAVDRLGDAVGGGLIRLVIVFAPMSQYSLVMSLGLLCSVGAILAASQLNRWYLRALETSLVDHAGDVTLADAIDAATARVLSTLRRRAPKPNRPLTAMTTVGPAAISANSPVPEPIRSEVEDILALQSTSRERIIAVLARPEGIPPGLVMHVIPLLGRRGLADYAVFALRKIVEEHVGQLADAMLNPGQPDDVRRRLAAVFSIGVSQRAVDALMLALDDALFGVRFEAGRSLAAILERNPLLGIDRQRIEHAVLRDLAPRDEERESRSLRLHESKSDGDERIENRLSHVFALLSLILPREAVQSAYRFVQRNSDPRLVGTALEYLEEVLPPPIRKEILPLLAHSHVSRARHAARRETVH
jgi:hypothetical protein